MNFIKTFLITLVFYFGLNALFLVVVIFLSPTFPIDDVFFVVSTLFSPVASYPGDAFMSIAMLATAFDLIDFMSILALIVPPLVAVVFGALLGDSSKISFFSWFLTAVISSIVYILLLIFGQDASIILTSIWASIETIYGLIGAILYIVFAGVVNGFFYGCISFLVSKD
ncbi:MAG: hypothetical protein ACFE96_08410 [Candidatus Hermodarchaeota archaeon]